MKISREEFYHLYGEEKLRFSSYYKYSFYFANDSKEINVCVGGSGPDEIYRTSVDASKEYTVKELNPVCGEAKKKDVIVHEFNEEYW